MDVDWQDRGTNEVDVRVEDLEYSNQAIDSVRLVVRGSRAAHQVDARVASNEADMRLTPRPASRIGPGAAYCVGLEVNTRSCRGLAARRTATLTASEAAVTLDELCMLASGGDFCIAGTWESQAEWQVRSSMSELPVFTTATHCCLDALTIDGTVSGQVDARGQTGTPGVCGVWTCDPVLARSNMSSAIRSPGSRHTARLTSPSTRQATALVAA